MNFWKYMRSRLESHWLLTRPDWMMISQLGLSVPLNRPLALCWSFWKLSASSSLSLAVLRKHDVMITLLFRLRIERHQKSFWFQSFDTSFFLCSLNADFLFEFRIHIQYISVDQVQVDECDGARTKMTIWRNQQIQTTVSSLNVPF